MEKKRSIPTKDVDFQVAQDVIVTAAYANRQKWALDEEWMDNLLMPAKLKWEQAWEAYANPVTRNPAITFAKNEQRKAYEKLLRILVKNLQSNTHVTPAELQAIGIIIPSPIKTLAPIATDSPDADVDTSVIGRITIHFFRRDGHHRKGKPDGQRGAEIRWVASQTPITRWENLSHSEFDTNSPFTLAFENDQRGQTVYFALRWENTRGEKGPWSVISDAIIP
jgi:hypothetical protein